MSLCHVTPLSGRLKIAATYKVSQPIENFSLRIKIVQQKSLLAELFETEDDTRDTNFLIVEERKIAWQEKIFSPSERTFYRDEKNCITSLEKEYYDTIIGMRRENSDDEQQKERDEAHNRLYTYTSRDHYYPDKTILTKNYVTPLASRRKEDYALPMMKNRKPFGERYNKNVVDTWPTETRVRENHCIYKDAIAMYVLVDLSSNDENNARSEHPDIVYPDAKILLCTVTYDRAGKTLTIDPDFTSDDSFYTLETSTPGVGYDFWIEHASLQRSNDDDDEQQRKLLHEEIERRRLINREVKVSEEIDMPPANILRVLLNLEILSACEFLYDGLFVTYYVDLPKNWGTNESERLTGRTQRSRVTREGTAHFSYVNEMLLDFDLKSLNDKNVQPLWPYLILTVGSLDSWTRYRIEGYASIPLPPTPGTHSFVLPTWRPVGRFVDVLRRFFTGGTSELEDITYCGISADSREVKRLEKTRLTTVPAGKINVKLHIVHQSKLFTKNRRLNRDALARLNAGMLINSLENVLEQFKAARERMIQARAMNPQSNNFTEEEKKSVSDN